MLEFWDERWRIQKSHWGSLGFLALQIQWYSARLKNIFLTDSFVRYKVQAYKIKLQYKVAPVIKKERMVKTPSLFFYLYQLSRTTNPHITNTYRNAPVLLTFNRKTMVLYLQVFGRKATIPENSLSAWRLHSTPDSMSCNFSAELRGAPPGNPYCWTWKTYRWRSEMPQYCAWRSPPWRSGLGISNVIRAPTVKEGYLNRVWNMKEPFLTVRPRN